MTKPDLEESFRQAYADPTNTGIELPAVDVNAVLAERYDTGEPLTLTRTMLWDAEVRKAWRPDVYIPSVVAEGTVDAWGHSPEPDGAESFVRMSRQRLWLRPDEYGLVLERVYVNRSRQTVTFLGAAELADRNGNPLRADTGQPLFHVEHSVAGEESWPLNNWRIVHLTDRPDDRVVEVFSRFQSRTWLPEFIEIYIRQDLEVELTRREGASIRLP